MLSLKITHLEKTAHTRDLPLGRSRLFCIQIQRDGDSIDNSACCFLVHMLFESLNLQSKVSILDILPLTSNEERNMSVLFVEPLYHKSEFPIQERKILSFSNLSGSAFACSYIHVTFFLHTLS